MRILLHFLTIALFLSFVSCNEYDEVEREVGYKGKARLNPWLAAEKFAKRYGHRVKSSVGWKNPEDADSTWIMPISVLSNKTYVDHAEQWMRNGGHLILIVEYASPGDDWKDYRSIVPEIQPPLQQMLDDAKVKIEATGGGSAGKILFEGKDYPVSANSTSSVADGKKKAGVFVSKQVGYGRLTVLTDGRILRNRWISDQNHAGLLNALMDSSRSTGSVGFMRGSGLSLWDMVMEHLWPILIALTALIILWLWKSLVRFGPVEPAVPVRLLRGYDHHLEALGDFQWRLDKASSLLAPIRALIVERGQRMSARVGRRDDDFFGFLAERSDIPRDRVFRALTEHAPADPAILTRTTADLQRLLQVIN